VQTTYSRTSRYTSKSCTLDFSSLDILYKRILNRNYFERVKNLVEFINIKEARARTIIFPAVRSRLRWFSQLDGVHQQKRCQIIFLKMFVKIFFQLVKPFLANLHSRSSKKYSYMYSMTPKISYFFLCIWVSKIIRILRWFQIRGNNWKKWTQKKLYAKKFCKLVV
jgi:hypothetical protein